MRFETFPLEAPTPARNNPTAAVWAGGLLAIGLAGAALWWFTRSEEEREDLLPEGLPEGLPTPEVPVPAAPKKYRVGETVEAEWEGKWYPARILEKSGPNYRVRYEGWGSEWDDWLTRSRLRKKT